MTVLYVFIAILAAGFVVYIFGRDIIKMIKGKPVEKCSCSSDMSRALKKARKDLKKKNCTCGCQNK